MRRLIQVGCVLALVLLGAVESLADCIHRWLM